MRDDGRRGRFNAELTEITETPGQAQGRGVMNPPPFVLVAGGGRGGLHGFARFRTRSAGVAAGGFPRGDGDWLSTMMGDDAHFSLFSVVRGGGAGGVDGVGGRAGRGGLELDAGDVDGEGGGLGGGGGDVSGVGEAGALEVVQLADGAVELALEGVLVADELVAGVGGGTRATAAASYWSSWRASRSAGSSGSTGGPGAPERVWSRRARRVRVSVYWSASWPVRRMTPICSWMVTRGAGIHREQAGAAAARTMNAM